MDMKDKYMGPFLDETEENLQQLNECLLAFEKGDQEVIDEMFRVAHTLKGMAGTMGFRAMMSLTHAMEDVLDGVRRGSCRLDRKDDVTLLFNCLDTLNALLEEIRKTGDDSGIDTTSLVGKLQEMATSARTPEITVQPRQPEREGRLLEVTVTLSEECLLKGARAYMVFEEVGSLGRIVDSTPPEKTLMEGEFEGRKFSFFLETEGPPEAVKEAVMKVSEIESCEIKETGASDERGGNADEALEEIREDESLEEAKNGSGGLKPSASGVYRTNQTVRVDVHRLDKLLNLVGELVIGRSRIERLAKDSEFKEFEEPILQLGRISKEIQELVTKLRMLPISFIFDRFPRLVRDLSTELGKKVELRIEGRETELDRSVIDEIGDPMVHLIRNSLDHGLESPEERVAVGKSETGLLRVRAYQDGSSVVVAVEDDGKGIDCAKVIETALEKGLVTPEQAENMGEREAYQLLFMPGFSTSREVTDLSGRGVGMDAVKSKVEALGGRVSIESKMGRGTSVKVKLPITLAIVLALLVEIGGKTYAIPLESVDETLRVEKDQVKVVNGSLVTVLRGEVLPLIDAREFYGLKRQQEEEDLAIVVMRTGFRRIGFVVDEFVGQQEIVIKSFGDTGITRIRWFSGGTILGDGSVVLIIDPAAVEESA
ncbi:MAG: CheA signal transduction histidine kinase [Synergistales bacterium 53_16]|nr:MAG: CheA signal transduction histidine kinase [Synergistales bacterium 53_16]